MTESRVRTDGPAPSRSAVDDIVIRIVSAWAPDPAVRVGLDDHLSDDLCLSSLRLVELAFILEELLAMEPATMGEAPPVGSVGDLCRFLWSKVDAGHATLPEPGSVDRVVASMR